MEELLLELQTLQAALAAATTAPARATINAQIAAINAQIAAIPVDPANAGSLIVNQSYRVKISGFTYIKDWALIKGSIGGLPVGVIIGEKMSFPMKDMFMLKDAGGVTATFKRTKTINGVDYLQFQLEEILF